jgi:hypothetical protein
VAKWACTKGRGRRAQGLGNPPIAFGPGFSCPPSGPGQLASWPNDLWAQNGLELRTGFIGDKPVDFWTTTADVVVMHSDRRSDLGVLLSSLAIATPIVKPQRPGPRKGGGFGGETLIRRQARRPRDGICEVRR